MSGRELEGVPVVPLARTAGATYKLQAIVDGSLFRGRTSAGGDRWSHYLARVEWHRGGRRLAVIARAETVEAMQARIRRELRDGLDAAGCVVFEVAP